MEIARPCPIHVSGCECTDDPVANFSAEAPDPVDVVRMAYIQNDPPMNSPDPFYTTPIGTGGCSGPNAQAAQDCATKEAQHDAWDPWVDPGNPSPQGVYGNQEQTCSIDCGEGFEPFVYTVPAGTVIAHSQAQANATAAAICEFRANSVRSCVPVPAMAPPVAWWRMDNAAAGNQVDIISGFRLTPIGPFTLVPGLVGDCIFLNNFTGWFTGADNGPAYNGGIIEVTGWFKANVITPDPQDFGPFYIRLDIAQIYVLWDSPNMVMSVHGPAGNFDLPVSFDPGADTGWHFYRISMDPIGLTMGIQFDDGPFTTAPILFTPEIDPAITFNIFLSQSGFSTMLVDEVAIWDRHLTAEEVATLYNGGLGTTWPLS